MTTPAVPLLAVDLPGARGYFSSRAGGVSTGPWADAAGAGGLNVAAHVGDDPGAVTANRTRLAAAVGAPIAWMDQVHGAEVAAVSEPGPEPRCDALVAAAGTPPLALGVLVADCVPVLLAGAGHVAAVHVGRQGLVRGVLEATLARLAAAGAGGAALGAAVGPSICGRCYEVPAALAEEVAAVAPAARARSRRGTPALDLPAAVLALLTGAGVRDVVHLAACTAEDERFYSYRRAGRGSRAGVTGRAAGVVVPA